MPRVICDSVMPFVKEKIGITVDDLKKYTFQKLFEIENVQKCASDYKKDNTPPADGWVDDVWMYGAHKHYWFKACFTTPAAVDGTRLLLVADNGVRGHDAMNPQGILYLNGQMVQGLDTNHREAYLEPSTEYEMYIYFYTATFEAPIKFSFYVKQEYINVFDLYYDILTPYEAFSVINENTIEYIQTLKCLEQACNIVDLRAPFSKAFFESVDKARDYLEREFYSALCSAEGKPTVNCIGHTHIDVEWKWARAQTREKVQRSFCSLIALMEKYPEYKFTLSQPELYRYLKEEAPEKYEQVKALVKSGRFEPEGAMWVECDCNLVSGESFVRQLLHGKRFFKDEFDVDSKVLFLPDVFGYSAALPQILKKSGVDYFVTSKISWNETNKLPVDSFMWQGIDGSEIYSSFITSQIGQKDHKSERYSTYVAKIDAPFVMGTWDRYQQKEYNTNTLLTFGYGDGGGGPNREMLEKYLRLKRGLPGLPVAKNTFLLDALDAAYQEFSQNSKKLMKTPKWVGELYLEFHRGTYTSVAKNKKYNRKSEFALAKAESLSVIDSLVTGGKYDGDGLYAMWQKVLHNQFHDILPGSSIHEVYEGTDKDYARIFDFCADINKNKLHSIAKNVATDGGIFVYNPLGFEHRPIIKLDGKTVEVDSPVPAFGWCVVNNVKQTADVEISGFSAQNKYYSITLDQSGAITSVFDKTAQRETVKAGERANRFVAFEDKPYQYDAWELSDYYTQKPYPLDDAANIEPVTDGSRAGFKVTKRYMDSMITQCIWLYSDSRRIDFETTVDWHQKHQVLKVFFPVDVYTDKASYEIQFGHVTRPTHKNTSWDKARFEVCAHKWVDISENGYGVALLNDCKYGFSADGTTVSLTALKCASYPDPTADEGMHSFTYSLLAHSGSLYDAGVIKESYKLNQTAEAFAVKKQNGSLDDSFSLVSCDKENVIIETLKQSVDGSGVIVRMYESFGSRGDVTVTAPFKKCTLCDLMENEIKSVDIIDGKVTLPIKNFEIITLKFEEMI